MFFNFFVFLILTMSASNNEIIIRNRMDEEFSVQTDDVIHVLMKYTVKYLKIEMFPHEITELIAEKWIVVDLIKILQTYFYPENLINEKEMADIIKLLMRTTINQSEIMSQENISSAFFVEFLRFIYLDDLSEKYVVSKNSSDLEEVKYLTDELIGYIKNTDIASSLNYIRKRFKKRFKMFIDKRNELLKKDERTFWKFDEAHLLSKFFDKKCDDVENNIKVLEVIQGRLNNYKSSFKMNVPTIFAKEERKVKENDSNRHSYSDYYEIGLVFESWNGKYSKKEIINTDHYSVINENHDYCEIEAIKPQVETDENLQKDSKGPDFNFQFSFYDEPRHIACSCLSSDQKQSINNQNVINEPTKPCSSQNCLDKIVFHTYEQPKPSKLMEQPSIKYRTSCLKRSQTTYKQEPLKEVYNRSNDSTINGDLYDNLPSNKVNSFRLTDQLMKNEDFKTKKVNKLKKSVRFKDQSIENLGERETGKPMKTLKRNARPISKVYQHPDASLVYLLIPERIPLENTGEKDLNNEEQPDFFFNVQKEGVLNFYITGQNNFILLILDFFEIISKFSNKKVKLEITIKHSKIVFYYTLEDISKSKFVCLEDDMTKLLETYEKSRNKCEYIKKLRMKFKNSKVLDDILKYATSLNPSIKENKGKVKKGSLRGLKDLIRIKKPIKRSQSLTENLEQPLSEDGNGLIQSLNLFNMMIKQSNLKNGIGLVSECSKSENNFFCSDKHNVLLENFIQTSVLQGGNISTSNEIKPLNDTLKEELKRLRKVYEELLELNVQISISLLEKMGHCDNFSELVSKYIEKYSHCKTLKDTEISLYLFIKKYNDLKECDFLNMAVYQINFYFNLIIEKINYEYEAKELASLIMSVLEFNKEQYLIIQGLCHNLILTRISELES